MTLRFSTDGNRYYSPFSQSSTPEHPNQDRENGPFNPIVAMQSYPPSSPSNGGMVARVVLYIPEILNLIFSLILSDQHRQFTKVRNAEYNSTTPNNTPPLNTQFPPENAIRNRQIGGTPLPKASMNFPPTILRNPPMDRNSVPPADSPTTAHHYNPNRTVDSSNDGTISVAFLVINKS